jgi:hypothetical protein
MSLTLEAGFRYFLIKWWYNIDANYYITPASEDSQMNAANYGGQGFKMITTYLGATNYIPQTPSTVPVMTETSHGIAARGARLSLDPETATLSADIPTSAELITNMNTLHFDNINSKIGILQTYKHPASTTADKLANTRKIAGIDFDGSAAIDIPYANLTNKPNLFSGSYNDLTSKPDLFSGSYTDLTNKPNLFSGSYTDLTNKLTAGSGITIDNAAVPPTISATSQTPTSVTLINILNTSQFTNNTGTSRIDIAPIPYYNLTYKIGVGNGLAISAGSATTNPVITLNLSAGGDIAINNAVNPATIGITYTSANSSSSAFYWHSKTD